MSYKNRHVNQDADMRVLTRVLFTTKTGQLKSSGEAFQHISAHFTCPCADTVATESYILKEYLIGCRNACFILLYEENIKLHIFIISSKKITLVAETGIRPTKQFLHFGATQHVCIKNTSTSSPSSSYRAHREATVRHQAPALQSVPVSAYK